jgi:microcystin degradation protein MlrC
MILAATDTKGPVDGALLYLHGAMVTKAHEDAEGELLALLRQKLGSRTPIIVTLDLHANVTRNMADNANALIAFRTYPHIDMHERAWQAAELLERAMRGEVRPVTVIARRPMLHGLDWGRTQRGPMAELIARGEALEADRKALAVSICAGFALANIHDVGPHGNSNGGFFTAIKKAQHLRASRERLDQSLNTALGRRLLVDEGVAQIE